MQTGRVVIVTGAGGGIGSKLVTRFVANGDTVVATDANPNALERLELDHSPLFTTPADVSSEDACERVAAVAREAAGRVDVLINCAGYFPATPFEELSADTWRRIIDVNLTSSFLMVKAVLPLMKGRGWGRIVNFGSASIWDGTRGHSHYIAAKAGIIGFSRALSREVGGYGITVNVITPGLTVTEVVREKFPPELLEEQRAGRSIQRDQLPEDLVGPAFFLASPDAGFISGQTINVDGGRFFA